MSREHVRGEPQPINLNLRLITGLVEASGLRLSDTGVIQPGVVGIITHLKGYGATVEVSSELQPEERAGVLAHLLGHYALGHTKEENLIWIRWSREISVQGSSCLDPSTEDPKARQQEIDAEVWARRILSDRVFYQQEKDRLATTQTRLK